MDRTNAERQRRYIQRLKARATGVSNAPDEGRDKEIARLKARIAKAEQDRDRYKQMAESRPAEPVSAPVTNGGQEARIAELEAQLASTTKERNEFGNQYWEIRAYLELRTEGIFTRKEFNKLRSWAHPDRAQGEVEKKRHQEAYELIGRCEKLLKKDPLPQPPKLPTTREELMEARLRVLKENRARGLKGAATRARKKPGRQLSRHDA
jgi:hypothetical protein